MITTVLLLCLVSTSVLLFFSLKKNVELVEIIEDSTEQVEKSLEILEFYQERIERKSKLEIMLDDPIVRELIEDMRGSKEALSSIKEQLVEFIQTEDEEEP